MTTIPARRSPSGFVAQHLPATLHAPAAWVLTAVVARMVTVTVLSDADVANWPVLGEVAA